jgi:hypothetical protein
VSEPFRSTLLFLCLFLCCFGPRLVFFDVHVAATAVSAVVGAALFLMRGPLDRVRTRLAITACILLSAPALVWSTVVVQAQGTSDYTAIWLTVKEIIYIFAAIGLLVAYGCHRGQDRHIVTFVRHLVIATAINAAFVVATVLSADIRAVVFTVFFIDGKEGWLEAGYRGIDLAAGGGATGSLCFACVLLLAYWCTLYLAPLGYVSMLLPFIAAASLLMGRTGGLVSVGLTCLWVLLCIMRGGMWGDVRRMLGGVALFLAAPFVLVVLCYPSVYEHFADVIFPWAFEYAYSDDLSTESGAALMEMYIYPRDSWDMALGVGNFGRGLDTALAYIPSDVGYVLLTYGFGVIGICFLSFKYVALMVSVRTQSGLVLAVAIGLLIAFAMLKEQFVSSRSLWLLVSAGFLIGVFLTPRVRLSTAHRTGWRA